MTGCNAERLGQTMDELSSLTGSFFFPTKSGVEFRTGQTAYNALVQLNMESCTTARRASAPAATARRYCRRGHGDQPHNEGYCARASCDR